MSLLFNGQTVRKVMFNNNNLSKVIFNGTVVFQSNITVDWSIYYTWNDTGSAIRLQGKIVDSTPLGSSDVITIRVKESEGKVYAYTELTSAKPENQFYENFYYFNQNNTVEFLVNGELKATATWVRPNKYSSSTQSGSVNIEL